MKSAKLFLLTLFLLAISALTFATQTEQTNEIPISGTTETPKGPSRAPATPSIKVYQTGDLITVYFLNDLGNVTITITDEAGTVVYLTTEPSGSGAVATIDLYGFESGSYTITFTNTDTFFNYGEFVF